MQKPEHLEDDLVEIYLAPVLLAFADEAMDAVNDLPSPARVVENVAHQFLEQLEVETAMRNKSPGGSGVGGDGGERLVQLVGQGRGQLAHQSHATEAGHLFALKPQVDVRSYLRCH